jgi:hypothetical protein
MLFEVMKDDKGELRLEKIAGWRNNPACIELLNVKSEAEAHEALAGIKGDTVKIQTDGSPASTTGALVDDSTPPDPHEPEVKKARRKSPQEG